LTKKNKEEMLQHLLYQTAKNNLPKNVLNSQILHLNPNEGGWSLMHLGEELTVTRAGAILDILNKSGTEKTELK